MLLKRMQVQSVFGQLGMTVSAESSSPTSAEGRLRPTLDNLAQQSCKV